MSDKVQPEASAKCSLRDRYAEAIRAVTDLWDEPLDEVHDLPQIVNAVLSQLAGQLERKDADTRRAIDHYVGALGIEKQRREAAEAEVARLRETVGRVGELARVQAISCQAQHRADHARNWLDVLAIIERAPRESATEAPRTSDGEQQDRAGLTSTTCPATASRVVSSDG